MPQTIQSTEWRRAADQVPFASEHGEADTITWIEYYRGDAKRINRRRPGAASVSRDGVLVALFVEGMNT